MAANHTFEPLLRSGCLSVPPCATCRQGAGTTLRWCAAPDRANQRAILDNDVPKPAKSASHGGSSIAARNGPHDINSRSQTIAEPAPA